MICNLKPVANVWYCTPCELLFSLSVTDLENNMADIAIAMGRYDDETTLDQI